MKKPSVGIAPEGAPFIGMAAFTALLLAILECWPLAILFWLAAVFAIYFFRNPERVIAQGPGIAASPADGTIVKIENRPDPFGGETRQCVSIFMSVFNVHVNRSPIQAEVRAIDYFPGKFFNASLDKASTDNERCAWLLQNASESWTMVQIAGLIARRIVPWAEPGDTLARGERIGLIRFGSRVDLYLPKEYTPAVSLGAKVYAGQTVIARKSGTSS